MQVIKIIETILIAAVGIPTVAVLIRVTSGKEKISSLTTAYFLLIAVSQIISLGLIWR